MKNHYGIILTGIFISLGSTACSKYTVDRLPPAGVGTAATPAGTAPVVCNPLGVSRTTLSPWNGIQAKLSYMPPENRPAYSGVQDFIAQATPVNNPVFMSEINVPTQLFTAGFTTTNGSLLRDNQGNPLLEYFGLELDSKIRLAAWDKPGLRQFALLADDGAILKINSGDGLTSIVANDGVHATQFIAANSAIWLGQQQDLPIHLDYFQGPREHIALMLLWRNITDVSGTGEQESGVLDPASLNDPASGMIGNDLFFNPSVTPSAPTALWQQMRSRGWEVVPAINFVLPGQDSINPCAQ